MPSIKHHATEKKGQEGIKAHGLIWVLDRGEWTGSQPEGEPSMPIRYKAEWIIIGLNAAKRIFSAPFRNLTSDMRLEPDTISNNLGSLTNYIPVFN